MNKIGEPETSFFNAIENSIFRTLLQTKSFFFFSSLLLIKTIQENKENYKLKET